jgi:hypothetical protein
MSLSIYVRIQHYNCVNTELTVTVQSVGVKLENTKEMLVLKTGRRHKITLEGNELQT